MRPPLVDLPPFDDFEAASRASLAYLYQRLGFALWMVTRTEGPDWIVLQAEDHGYGVEEGTVFRWADSFCSQMVIGRGPRVAPEAKKIRAYASAPIGQQVRIGAYIGVPLAKQDGSLFGTLCAIDPQPQCRSICEELPAIELVARLLGTVLVAELKAVEQARVLAMTREQAHTDALTGVLNRRGWDRQLAVEAARARRYGNPACVLIVDLDEVKLVNDTQGHAQGDALIRHAAHCLRKTVRESDVVARIGGDEFAILAIECDHVGAEALLGKISDTLERNGVRASVGKAMRDPVRGLSDAAAAADRAMYLEKARHRRMESH